jgi:hypothetical protein
LRRLFTFSTYLTVPLGSEDETRRVMAHGKHNLSEPGEARRFRIEGVEVERDDGYVVRTSRIVWFGEADVRSSSSLTPTTDGTLESQPSDG